MNQNKGQIEEQIENLLKKTAREEPSQNFTERVMKSVYEAAEPVSGINPKVYSWTAILLVLFFAIAFSVYNYTFLLAGVKKIILPVYHFAAALVASLEITMKHWADLAFSPLLLIGSLTIIILLFTETLITKDKFRV